MINEKNLSQSFDYCTISSNKHKVDFVHSSFSNLNSFTQFINLIKNLIKFFFHFQKSTKRRYLSIDVDVEFCVKRKICLIADEAACRVCATFAPLPKGESATLYIFHGSTRLRALHAFFTTCACTSLREPQISFLKNESSTSLVLRIVD